MTRTDVATVMKATVVLVCPPSWWCTGVARTAGQRPGAALVNAVHCSVGGLGADAVVRVALSTCVAEAPRPIAMLRGGRDAGEQQRAPNLSGTQIRTLPSVNVRAVRLQDGFVAVALRVLAANPARNCGGGGNDEDVHAPPVLPNTSAAPAAAASPGDGGDGDGSNDDGGDGDVPGLSAARAVHAVTPGSVILRVPLAVGAAARREAATGEAAGRTLLSEVLKVVR